MNPFLSPAWLAVMQEQGTVSASRLLDLAGEPCAVGEVRLLGSRHWSLFGTPPPPHGERLAALFRHARAAGVLTVGAAFNMSRWPEAAVTAAGARVLEPFGTYLLDLSESRETLWSRVHATHRRWIRRAEREGVVVAWEWSDDAFLALLAETYARGGKPSPVTAAHLAALRRHLGGQLLLAGAFQGERLEAAVAIPWDGARGYYLHGASRAGEGTVGAAHLLHWRVALRLRELGVALYDLGGARPATDDPRLQGIFQFKARFGGRFEPCCYWRKVIRPVAYQAYRLLARSRGL